MKMLRNTLILLFAASVLVSQNVYAEKLVVIVNKKNSVSNLSQAQVRRIFLRETKSWPNGSRAKVLVPNDRNPIKGKFLSGILEMSEEGYVEYWLKEKQLAGQSEPAGVPSDRLSMRLVNRSAKAVSVVSSASLASASASEKANIKPVFSGDF